MAGRASPTRPVDPRLSRWQRHSAQGQGLRDRADVGEHSVFLLPGAVAVGAGFMLTSAVLVTVYILRQKTLPKS